MSVHCVPGSFLACAIWALAPSMGAGQSVPPLIRVPDNLSCSTCTIEVRLDRVLGDTAGDGELPRAPHFVRMDEKGRVFLSFLTPDLPLMFASDGRFLSTLSRIGSGPGELRMPLLYHVANDTAWFADLMNGRRMALVLDGERGRAAGSWPMQGVPFVPFGAIRLSSGAVVFNGNVLTEDRIGLPLHLLDGGGTTRSFGALVPEFRPNLQTITLRGLAPAAAGGFWALLPNRYEIERYDLDGTLLRRWERSVSWFTPHRGDQLTSAEHPPQPKAMALSEDGQGRLWMLVLVPDPRHREAFGPSPGPGLVDLREPRLYFDTIIEVFDPRVGRIVASRRVDDVVSIALGATPDGIVAAGARRLEYGRHQIAVWRLRLDLNTGSGSPSLHQEEEDRS